MKAGSEFIALEEVFRLDCISNQGRYLYPTMIWPGNADYDAFFSKSFDDWFVWLEKEQEFPSKKYSKIEFKFEKKFHKRIFNVNFKNEDVWFFAKKQ